MKVTQEEVMNALTNVIDPELNISIVDLGLIYEVHINGKTGTPEVEKNNPDLPSKNVYIILTLTTLGCPLYGTIEADIKKNVGALGFAPDDIELELVFDPPWSMERMSESAKAMLGI